MKMLFQVSQSDTNIYQYRIRLSVKIVAITTTSTAEGNKSQHLKLYFHAKLAKKTHITKFFSTFVAIFSKLIGFKHQLYGKKCGSLFGFLSLMSCQPHEGSEEQLKADVDSFATYYYNWHFEKAARFCTPESKVWLRYAASNVHPADIELLKAKNEDAHIEIGDIDFKEDEVSATVNLEITNFLQMDTIGKEARLINKSKLTLPMTIHNGKWKVELKQLPTLQK